MVIMACCNIIEASLSEPHIVVVSFALLSVRLLPEIADCAKLDRMWVSTIHVSIIYIHKVSMHVCVWHALRAARTALYNTLRVWALPRSRDC